MPSVMDNKIKILEERETRVKEAQRKKSMAHKGRNTSSFEASQHALKPPTQRVATMSMARTHECE